MRHILLFSILLIMTSAIQAQLEEGFSPAPSGWILAQGANFSTLNGNGVVVTPSGGGNNHSVIGTPAVNKVSNTFKVCIDVTAYTSNLNDQIPLPCASYLDVLFVKSTVTTANDAEVPANIIARVDNHPLPTNGGTTCFTFNFPLAVTDPNFKVVLSFHADCNQGGTKYVLDNMQISGVDDVCSGTCAPTALNDVFTRSDVSELSFNAVLYGSNLNYPVPGANVAVDATGTDNDQNDTYAHLQWSLVTPPSNGSVVINADGTCTITRNNLAVKTVTFTYRLCDDGADDNFATTGDNSCDDGVVTVNFASNILTPVLLTDFSATRNGTTVLVKWSTGTESNNNGFSIQRSVNGGAYQTAGYIASKAIEGNSSVPLQYTFTERNDNKEVTTYRLVQEDKDGRKTVYGIKVVPGLDGVAAGGIRLSANPVTTGSVSIYFDNVHARGIQICDMNGRLVSKWTAYAQNNLLVNGLHPGVFLILVTDNVTGEKATQKLVVTQ